MSMGTKFVFILFFLLPLMAVTLPLFFIYYHLVLLIVRVFKPKFGKILRFPSSCLDEDFSVVNIPKYGICTSLVLNGDLKIEEIRRLFINNVLERKINNKIGAIQKQKRYPELTQFVTSFLGQRFWKEEEAFQINEHLLEGLPEWAELPLGVIHEETLKRKFYPGRSPWEVILLRDYSSNSQNGKTLLIFNIHHSMADAKSIIKLIVECLGNSQLTTSSSKWTPKKALVDHVTFPVDCAITFLNSFWNFLKILEHPWRKPRMSVAKQPAQFVRFSERLPMSVVKGLACKFKVSPSAVIAGLIAGAVRKAKPGLKDFPGFYILPKPEHPATFDNHFWISDLTLPCDAETIQERFQKCDKDLTRLRSSNTGMHLHGAISLFTDYLSNSVRKNVMQEFLPSPSLITNIAGERYGFKIGGVECEDFTLSLATGNSHSSIVFAILSYKEHIRYAVIGDRGLFTKEDVENLVNYLHEEYHSATLL